MKKLLLIAVATLVCVSAFAQGKLAFLNGPQQLIYFTTDKTGADGTGMVAADANKVVGGFALAGSSVYTGAGGTIASLTGSPSLTVALFGGPTAGSLSLQTVGVLGDVNFGGLINPQVNATFPTLPAGVPAFFRIDVYDSRVGSAAEAWAQVGLYGGTSGVFQATPQASVYSPIWVTGAPVNSTLPVGTFVPLDYVGFAGYNGSIEVYATVPEPGTLALAGLGLASLLIFRRRK